MRRAMGLIVIIGVMASAVSADVVVFASTTPTGQKTAGPLYQELIGTWSQQSIHSAASPGAGARTSVSAGAKFSITPTLGEAGGIYTFDITHGTAGGMTTDLVMSITVTGGTLVDSQGAVISTTAFRKGGDHTWEHVGVLKLYPGVSAPTLTFAVSGTYTNRLFVDGFRFEQVIYPVCNVPYADADADGDVDQADFGTFQACFAGAGLIPSGYCLCFDRHPSSGDRDVDEGDYERFLDCITGPGLPWSQQTFPACAP